MNTMERLRTMKGLSRQQLADIVGVQMPTIFRYEKEVCRPSPAVAARLADALGVGVDTLLEIQPKIKDVMMVPVIDSAVCVSAGPGCDCYGVEWNIVDNIPVPTKELMAYNWQGTKYFVIYAEGNSMEPQIHDGDRILFADTLPVFDGDIAIVSVDDDLVVKGVKFDPDKKTITLLSFNDEEYPARTINTEEHEIKILGKVLYAVPKLKRLPSFNKSF